MGAVLRVLLLTLVVAGCGAAATQPPFTKVPQTQIAAPAATVAASITIHGGDPSLIDYRGGRYLFTWTLPGGKCASFWLALAPVTSRTDIVLHSEGPATDASVVVDVPAGRAYLNSSGCAGYAVTITPQ